MGLTFVGGSFPVKLETGLSRPALVKACPQALKRNARLALDVRSEDRTYRVAVGR
jgi:hypothetical protein